MTYNEMMEVVNGNTTSKQKIDAMAAFNVSQQEEAIANGEKETQIINAYGNLATVYYYNLAFHAKPYAEHLKSVTGKTLKSQLLAAFG